MSFIKRTSFANGEVDPSLHDNTDIKAYYSGLKTARNVTLGKTGRILNTAGTWLYDTTDETRLYVPENQDLFFEFGVGYVRCHPLTELKNQNYKKPTMYDGYKGETFTGDGTTTVFNLNTSITNPFTIKVWEDSSLVDLPDYTLVGSVLTFVTAPANGVLIRVYPVNMTITDYTQVDLSNLYFSSIKDETLNFPWVYVACEGKSLQAFYGYVTEPTPSVYEAVIELNSTSTQIGVGDNEYPIVSPFGATTPTIEYNFTNATMVARNGHNVVYGVTFVTLDGVESPVYQIDTYISSDAITSSTVKLPTNGEITPFYIKNIQVQQDYGSNIKHINVYRRPVYSAASTGGDGFAWGLIGQSVNGNGSNYFTTNLASGFNDFGQEADYTNPPPEQFDTYSNITNGLGLLTAKGVKEYNNRMILWSDKHLFASKINAHRYFLRDFPLSATTSFTIQVGTAGEIYHVVESNGLIVFTSEGIFYGGYDTPISSENPILPKRSKIVIKPSVPPLNTPYGVFFIDRSTNTIKILDYNDNSKSLSAEDVSLFSDHLFYLRKVKSWTFKEGNDPHLEVVMDDGALLHLTYNRTEKIMAWTRHDTLGSYKDVVSYYDLPSGDSYSIYNVQRDSGYTLEISSKRIKKETQSLRCFSHSSVHTKLTTAYQVALELTTLNWGDEVRHTGAIPPYLATAVDKTFIAYTSDFSERVYLKLVSATTELVFEPSGTIPVELRTLSVPNPISIYECHDTVTGLDHIEGMQVSVIGDGGVLSSPNNDHESDKPAQVLTVAAGGTLTLPFPVHESIVGLPYISDIETLEIDNRNGSDLINAKITNSVVVKYSRSRGGFVGKFHDDTIVKDMDIADSWNRFDNINLPLADKSVRRTHRTYSDYQLNGKIAIRQVDPLPLEVVSIILDVTGG